MKVDLNKPFLNIKGEPVVEESKGVILGQVLASYFANTNKGDALKLFGWAEKLYAGETLDIDESDVELMRNTVKDAEQLSNAMKAQVLRVLNKKD